MNWILDNIHHPWSSVITPYGAWFTYVVGMYLLYAFYLWASQKPQNAGLHERVRWIEWKNTIPFFGIKGKDKPSKSDKITNIEKSLFDEYKSAILNGTQPNKHDYDHYLEYVHLAGDTDQKLMTTLSWFVLGLLGSLEMASLVQMLIDILVSGGFSHDDAKNYGMVGGMFLGAISAFIVHKAAHESYKRQKVRISYDEFMNNGGKREDIKALSINDKRTESIYSSDAYQLLRRADKTDVDSYGKNGKTSGFVISSISLITLIVVFAFGVRYVTYTSQFSSVNCEVEYVADKDALSVCLQDNVAKSEQKQAGLLPVLIGNALFSVLYVFLLFGLYIYSYKRSFLSSNSKEAFEKIKGNVSGFDSIKDEIDRAIASADHIRSIYAEEYYKKRNNSLNDLYFIQYLSVECENKKTCEWECVESYKVHIKHEDGV
jgi:hypothetical protein